MASSIKKKRDSASYKTSYMMDLIEFIDKLDEIRSRVVRVYAYVD
jgi:hypothetical protein